MFGTKPEWLQSEPNRELTSFQPSAEDRENLLTFWDAWDKAMAEQDKMMPMVERLIAAGDLAAIKDAIYWFGNAPHAARAFLLREWRRLSEAAPAPAPAPVAKVAAGAATVKVKGKSVLINGFVVGSVHGWRNPNGTDHIPYEVRLANGQTIGGFAYFADALSWCRLNAQTLAELVENQEFDVKAALGLQ